jgi:hypothetical protein
LNDPFPIQGRILGRLTQDLHALETRRTAARRAVGADDTPITSRTRQAFNAAGNEHVLRAIPVCALGVPGAIPGTRPDQLPWETRR